MKPENKYLAIDLGAESGRAVIGSLGDSKIFLEEVHRFSTGMLFQNDHYYWNIYRFYEEILNALKICKTQLNTNPDSMAVDTWGVDFGLLAEDGSLLRIPYAYRDPQSAEAMTEFLDTKLSAEKISFMRSLYFSDITLRFNFRVWDISPVAGSHSSGTRRTRFTCSV